MRIVFVTVCLAVGLVGCGSSSGTPAQACDSLASAICTRAFQCDPNAAADYGGTVSSCISQVQSGIGCSSISCSAGQTFNSGAANSCVNDVGSLACSEFIPPATPTYPTICSSVCQ